MFIRHLGFVKVWGEWLHLKSKIYSTILFWNLGYIQLGAISWSPCHSSVTGWELLMGQTDIRTRGTPKDAAAQQTLISKLPQNVKSQSNDCYQDRKQQQGQISDIKSHKTMENSWSELLFEPNNHILNMGVFFCELLPAALMQYNSISIIPNQCSVDGLSEKVEVLWHNLDKTKENYNVWPC